MRGQASTNEKGPVQTHAQLGMLQNGQECDLQQTDRQQTTKNNSNKKKKKKEHNNLQHSVTLSKLKIVWLATCWLPFDAPFI